MVYVIFDIKIISRFIEFKNNYLEQYIVYEVPYNDT